jgi:hydrogenase maturation protein HypF
LAAALAEACGRIRDQTGLATVALSGGCFQSRLLTRLTADRLRREGLEVLLHARVPPNDGGIALGQAAVAAWRTRGESP